MPTLNLNDMIGGVNVFGPNGLNTNLQQHQAAETQPTRPGNTWTDPDIGVDATDALIGHHHRIALTPLQDSVSALEARIGELDATNDDIYQKLDTLQEKQERRLSMDNQVTEVIAPEEKDVVISIMKTKKTTEVVVANAILESISNLVKKG